jgi:hypothetical protein
MKEGRKEASAFLKKSTQKFLAFGFLVFSGHGLPEQKFLARFF